MHRLLSMIIMECFSFFFPKPFVDVLEAVSGLGIENRLEVYSSRLRQIAGFCKDACLLCHPCFFWMDTALAGSPGIWSSSWFQGRDDKFLWE